MSYIAAEDVAKAKEMDLLTYLRNYEPQELVHVSGNTYCTREHDSLRISNGKWCWFSQGIGGRSALDYVKKGKRIFIIFIASFLLISGLVLLSIYNGSGTLPQKEVDGQVETNFETDNTLSKLNGDTKEQKTEESQSEPELLPEGSYFEIHFIDVGQADAELIICDDHAMLVDGGYKSDSSLIYSYLKKENITELDYIICSHPHEDHVGGLAGALNYAKAKNALCPVDSYDSDGFNDFKKYLDNQGVEITKPAVGESFSLGNSTVSVLGPTINGSGNNNSLVLRVVYGQTSFLLTGDAEFEEEQYMLNSGQELSSTVLKVGHHGSDSSTSAQFLNAVMPQYAVISVGTDNAYGHPSQAVLDNFKQFNVDVFRTDLQGDVICSSNGQSVSFTVEKNKDADTLSTVYQDPVLRVFPFDTQPENIEADNIDYVLNTNTKKYHYPDCSSVNQMKDKNKEFYSGTREEIIAKGHSPCGNCRP